MARAIKQWIRRKVLRDYFGQEYLCLPLETSNLFTVEISFDNSKKRIPLNQHLFLGYKPLLIGVNSNSIQEASTALGKVNQIGLHFLYKNQELGRLQLERVGIREFEDVTLGIFKGISAHHNLLPWWCRLMVNWYESRKQKAAGNIDLDTALYSQVRLAYALPRKISLISLVQSGQHNLFPTDLHGEVSDDIYVGSLRLAGDACKQVDEIGKILLADMPLSSYKEVYALGKNHMQNPRGRENFAFLKEDSEHLKIAVPQGACNYRELEKIDALDVGLHRLQFYRVINSVQLQEPDQTLAHIHFYYADWRLRQGLKTDILVR